MAEERLAPARHEAIHAVLHAVLKLGFGCVTIVPGDESSEQLYTRMSDETEEASRRRVFSCDLQPGPELVQVQMRWIVATAGPWTYRGLTWSPDLDAEREFHKDQEVASHHARRILGLDERGQAIEPATDPKLREVEVMKKAETCAKGLIHENSRKIDHVAAVLEEKRELTEAEVLELCGR
jgi:hypothetical protein